LIWDIGQVPVRNFNCLPFTPLWSPSLVLQGHASTDRHVSYSTGPASVPRWAPDCHVSSGSGPHLPVREGFGAAMCTVALDLASLLVRAPVPPRVQWLRTLPLLRGLWCCHASCGSQWAVGLKHNEESSWHAYAARITYF
jgi:hypothetical protein